MLATSSLYELSWRARPWRRLSEAQSPGSSAERYGRSSVARWLAATWALGHRARRIQRRGSGRSSAARIFRRQTPPPDSDVRRWRQARRRARMPMARWPSQEASVQPGRVPTVASEPPACVDPDVRAPAMNLVLATSRPTGSRATEGMTAAPTRRRPTMRPSHPARAESCPQSASGCRHGCLA
jgi:hypothetical protein